MNLFKSKKLEKAHLSIMNGSLDELKSVVDSVIFKKMFINKRLPEGPTLLLIAIREGKQDIVDYLINYGADVEKLSLNKNNALSVAIITKQDEILYDLIYKYKANWLKKGYLNKKPASLLKIALAYNNLYAIELLAENKISVKNEDLIYAIKYGAEDVDFLEKLITKYELDLNFYTEEYSITPLVMAIVQNKIETLKFLLNNGADPNFCEKNQNRGVYAVYPLGVAIVNHNFDAFKILIESGAYVLDEVIMVILLQHDVDMLRYLFSSGYNILPDFNKMKEKYPNNSFARCDDIFEFVYSLESENKKEIAEMLWYRKNH